jgi:hypothetical protein
MLLTGVKVIKSSGKKHVVAFRLNDEEYEKLASAAFFAGENPNEWVRKLALGELRGDGMTRNDRAIFDQVAVTRHVIGRLLRKILSPHEFEELKRDLDQHKGTIIAKLLSRSGAARDFSTNFDD